MPRGDKSKYTSKQVRQAEHIEQGYEARGVPKAKAEAERRAWATENKITHGGKKPGGSGRDKAEDHSPMRKGGRTGGTKTAAKKTAAKNTVKKTPTKTAARTRRTTT